MVGIATKAPVRIFGVLFFCLCAAFGAYSSVSAQSFNLGATVELDTNPDDPLPNSITTVTLAAYTVNTNGSSIRWYVDGGERVEARDTRTVTVETGPIGSSMTVRAVVTPQSGTSITVERTLKPSQIDLVIEANSRVPSFYEGRALPVGDELVMATVIPHVPNGSSPDSLTYTWKLDNKVILGGPVKGVSQTSFAMPDTRTSLNVVVSDALGNRVGGTTVNLEPAEPELYFYEDNPLRSMSRQAIKNSGTFTLVGDEVSVRAEPYFVASNIFEKNPQMTWTLDGRAIQNFGGDVQALTLRGDGGTGENAVGFELINPESLLQFVKESFTIHFE